MTTILVVDDSAVDRRLAGRLMETDADLDGATTGDGFVVEYAVHGAEALAKMEHCAADLVLTDLMMPEMDGLELVAAVRSEYPLVPVILMTSKGSEEIAVEALQRGAASYVPKRRLAAVLLHTVHRVLAISSRQRSHTRLMQRMTKNDCAFVLGNDSTMFTPLVIHLQEAVAQMGLCDETERTRIGVALEEALANALYHGNLEVGSVMHEEDGKAYLALVEKRSREAPYGDRRIYVQAKLTRDGATFILQDDGRGFDPEALPDPTDPANLDKASGRGVLLMRTFMDEVVYNQSGNVVTLVKRRGGNNDPAEIEDHS